MSTVQDRTFTIGELAREFDITPRAIRHYEDQGLLEPERRGQHRIYSRRDRVRLMLTLRGAGTSPRVMVANPPASGATPSKRSVT